MRITHDPAADAAYVYLVDRIEPGESKRQEVTEGGLVLDYDADGKLLGIEILYAGRLLRPETIESAPSGLDAPKVDGCAARSLGAARGGRTGAPLALNQGRHGRPC
jgi:uncharacterized protein YuzE